MKRRLFVLSAVAALSGLVAPAPASAEPEIPASPMDFNVTMSGEGMDGEPDCTPGQAEMEQLIRTKGSADITCKLVQKTKDTAMNGTVSNPTLAAADPGFNDGTLTQTCDIDQSIDMAMTIGMRTNKLSKFKGKMAQACVWEMTFKDAKSSTLAGTMEMNGTMGSDDGAVANNAVTMTSTMKVYMVEGTGIFEGYTGGGEFSLTETMDMMGGQGGGGGSGGSGPTSTSTSVPTPGGGSGSTPTPTPEQIQKICSAAGLTPCNQSTVMQFCSQNMAACTQAVGAQRVRATRLLVESVSKSANSEAMTLTLKKGAGAVRILSPAAPTGQPKSAATVTKSTRVEIVATPGATCSLRTNRGKVVATKTVTSADSTVMAPKSGALRGATSIQAVCRIGTATVRSNSVKVKYKG